MTDDNPLIDIETHRGVPIALNLMNGQFQARIRSGLLQAETLRGIRGFIRQALLIERALESRDGQEALHD